MHKLYDIIFPPNNPDDATCSMYLRRSGSCSAQILNQALQLRSVGSLPAEVTFDTYFNSFSIAKWRKYTYLENLSLLLRYEGVCTVHLCAVDAANIETELDRRILDSKGESEHSSQFQEVTLPFPAAAFNAPEAKNAPVLLFWKITVSAGETCVIHVAAYWTDAAPEKVSDVDLSVVICTYKREAYVLNTLQAIIHVVENTPDLSGKIQVRLTDNGQSLDPRTQPEIFLKPYIHLYPNLNSGGSGGFARGILETLDAVDRGEQRATHVLLMDDDIELPRGVLEKTFALLRLVKDEYEEAFVGGAMLNIDERNMQSVGEETYGGFFVIQRINEGLDLAERTSLIANELPVPKGRQHQAWWYCSIPIRIIREKGLPYPFFFQMDDIEYSMRTGSKIMHLDGIAVWHEPFHKKIQNAKEFFIARNGLALCALQEAYTAPMLMRLMKRVVQAVLINNYQGIEAVVSGMQSFFQGPEQFTSARKCTEILAAQSRWNQQRVPLGKDARAFSPTAASRFTTMKKILSIFTLNGHLVPGVFLHDAVCGTNIRENLPELLMNRSVTIVEADNEHGYVYRQSLCALWKSGLRLAGALIFFLRNRKRLNQEYQKKRAEITGIDFWRRYLSSGCSAHTPRGRLFVSPAARIQGQKTRHNFPAPGEASAKLPALQEHKDESLQQKFRSLPFYPSPSSENR